MQNSYKLFIDAVRPQHSVKLLIQRRPDEVQIGPRLALTVSSLRVLVKSFDTSTHRIAYFDNIFAYSHQRAGAIKPLADALASRPTDAPLWVEAHCLQSELGCCRNGRANQVSKYVPVWREDAHTG